jgi:hypothetical protein
VTRSRNPIRASHHRVGRDHAPGHEPQQQDQRQRLQHRPLDEGARALQVEHAAGDQVPGVDLVVETERQPLQLLEELQAQVQRHLLAEIFPLVPGRHGQEAPRHRGDDHQAAGGQQRHVRVGHMPGSQRQAVALAGVDRHPQAARDGQADRRRHQRGQERQAEPPRIAQGQARDAPQHSRHRRDIHGRRVRRRRAPPLGGLTTHRNVLSRGDIVGRRPRVVIPL